MASISQQPFKFDMDPHASPSIEDLCLDENFESEYSDSEDEGSDGSSALRPHKNAWGEKESDEESDTDTDLEEDMLGDTIVNTNDDSYKYKVLCESMGAVPVQYYLRHMNDAVFRCDNHGLGPDGAAALARALLTNTEIKALSLRGNDIRGDGARHLGHMLKNNAYIEVIDIAQNNLRSEGLNAFADVIASPDWRVQELDLAVNGFLDMDAHIFCNSLKSDTSLITMGVSGNRFGDTAAIEFANMLIVNTNLKNLDLSWNCIRKRGATALAEALKQNTSLENLNLGFNAIGTAGALAFAEMLNVNNTLTSLDLSGNNIGDAGAVALAAVIKSKSGLISLGLSHNKFTSASVMCLLEAIESNQGLSELMLDGIELDAACQQVLKRICTTKPGLSVTTNRAPKSDSSDVLREKTKLLEEKLSEMASAAASRLTSPTNSKHTLHIGGNGNMNLQPRLPPHLVKPKTDGALSRAGSLIIELDELDDFDSDDEDANRMREWRLNHPDLDDPMLALESYVYNNRLRLVDLFTTIDKDRSGTVTTHEIRHAVTSLEGLALNEEQQDELMARLDYDGNGVIDYQEMCEGELSAGRRSLVEKLRHRDPRWTTYTDGDDDDEN
eukprot:m.38036 g.38036  ORF g.38036 m.38036 type:complete len:613 (-) comp17820_c1_seq1:84-1922(-)